MDVKITSFASPFSFFCLAENGGDTVRTLENTEPADSVRILKTDVSDFNHGQYVAVMWKDKWVRGVVTMESQFLVWLVDYGLYIRPTEKTVITNLPADYKKYPTKVFEASIHGVCPVGKVVTEDCQINNEVTLTWTKGAIEKAQALIASAVRTHFVPIAILDTKNNDIVLGNLYLQLVDIGVVNIVDELQLWPVFLEVNPAEYIKNLPNYYTTRRKLRTSLLKPEFDGFNIPIISPATTLVQYKSICANAPPFHPSEFGSDSGDGSTVVTKANRDLDDDYKLTPAEIEKYSRMYVTVYGHEYNVLNILLNKLNDLRLCEKYKNHDLKRVGRATYHRRNVDENDD